MKKLVIGLFCVATPLAALWYGADAVFQEKPAAPENVQATAAAPSLRPQPAPEIPDPASEKDSSEAPAMEPGEISGRVFDAETQAGLPHIKITAMPVNRHVEHHYLHARPATVTTDAEGQYQFKHIMPGQWEIQLDCSMLDLQDYCAPNKRTLSYHVVAGESIQQANFPVQRGIRLSGVVVDEHGRPVEGVRVDCSNPKRIISSYTTLTDAEGRFSFAPEPPHTHICLYAYREGEHSSTTTISAMQDTDDIVLRLTNHYEHPKLTGYVVNLAGDPVRMGELRFERKRRLYFNVISLPYDGFFDSSLKPDIYTVTYKDLEDGIHEVEPGEIEVVSGENYEDVYFVVDVPSSSADHVITGRVTNMEGEPISNASISAKADKGVTKARCSSDEHGRFALTGLVEGTYKVTAYNGSSPQTIRHHVVAGEQHLNLVVSKGGRIEGQVLSADTRNPVTAFTVDYDHGFYRDEFEMPMLIDHPEGRFLLEGLYIGEDWEGPLLKITAPGYAPFEERVVIQPVEIGPIRKTFIMEQGAQVDIAVLRPDGSPAVDVPLTLDQFPEGGRGPDPAMVGVSSIDGTFVLESLTPGEHTLYANDEQHGVSAVTFTVQRGERKAVELALNPVGSISGQFLFNGAPIPNAMIAYYIDWGNDNSDAHWIAADGNGWYQFENSVPAGTHRLSAMVRHPELVTPYGAYGMTRYPMIDVAPDQQIRLDFHFPFGDAGIEGYITQAGQPVPGAEITVYARPESIWTVDARAGEDGYYRAEGLAAGTVLIEAKSLRGYQHITKQLSSGTLMRLDIAIPE